MPLTGALLKRSAAQVNNFLADFFARALRASQERAERADRSGFWGEFSKAWKREPRDFPSLGKSQRGPFQGLET